MQTFNGGIEGRLALKEGELDDSFVLSDRSQFAVQWLENNGRPGPQHAWFTFQPGPIDWPEGKTLELGESSGVHLRLTGYLCHARTQEDWIADPSEAGPPVLKIAVSDPDGSLVAEQWLAGGPDPRGQDAITLDSLKIQFQQASASSMLDDFLKPPEQMGPGGVLSVHYQGRVQRIPVSANVGKKVPLGDSGVSVEMADYYPNAKVVADNQFVSEGKEPKNPVLELRVHMPGKKEPIHRGRLPLSRS